MSRLRTLSSRFLRNTPLQYWPVTVRQGLAAGARWTLLPFSSYWRLGGEPDVAAGLKLLQRVKGAVCWDLGAHFGIHTIGLAMQVGAAGEVAAFEPDELAFKRLERHVRSNQLANIKLFNLAASDFNGELELIIAGGLGSSVTHARYEDELPASAENIFRAKAATLDSLVEAGRLRLPDFIKVDVEGHGAKAFQGGLAAITRSRPLILFSAHGQNEWDGVRALLEPLGYQVVDVDGMPVGWATQHGAITLVFKP